MTIAKTFLVFALGLALLMWAMLQEQRVAIECMNGGHRWQSATPLGLVGECLPGKPSARIYLPPMQLDPMPAVVDPEPEPVPPL